MTTRSAVLAAGELTVLRDSSVLTCPLGKVLIVKTIVLNSSVAAGSVVVGYFTRPDAGTIFRIFNLTLVQNKPQVLEHWFVMDGLDQLVISVASPPLQYHISGAILPARPP